jgi:hypothetical protein
MTNARYPYLMCEKAAFRGRIGHSEAPTIIVILIWYCRHSSHGMRLELRDARSKVEKHCAACSLPRRRLPPA